MNIKSHTGNILFVCLLLILSIVHFYQKSLLAYTGDEPRFAYYAYSIVKGETLKYPTEKFEQETGSPNPSHTLVPNTPITLNLFNKNMFMMNSITAPLLYAPALFLGKDYKSWELLRTAAFLYYCGALIFIWLSLKTIFSTKESLVALAITTLSLPQLAQMSLGNTEQAAIFFLASTFYFLIFRRQINVFSIVIGTISMCLIAFASMRCMPFVVFLAAGFLIRLWRMTPEHNIDKCKIFFIFLTIGFVGGFGWAAMQLSFTGTLTGSSLLNETLADKSLLWFLHRLYVPMLHHRDGIFLLFPLVFASFLGLINAARKQELIAWISLSAWLSYYFLISLTSQSEGYAGRLQFVLIEFFIIGLAFYIRDFRNSAAIGILIIGFIISSIMVFGHLVHPPALVENREFGLFQQILLKKTHILDFGQYLIWDKHSRASPSMMPLFLSETWKIGFKVFFFLSVVGGLLLISISNRCKLKIRTFSRWCALLLTIAGTYSLLVVPVPQQSVSITRTFVDEQSSLKLTFNKPIHGKITITFGPHPFWHSPECPSFFLVKTQTENGISAQYQKRSMPEIRMSGLKNVKSITINGDSANSPWNAGIIEVYRSFRS